MRCSNCSREINSNVNKCPFCETPVNLFELPKLKEEEKEESENEKVNIILDSNKEETKEDIVDVNKEIEKEIIVKEPDEENKETIANETNEEISNIEVIENKNDIVFSSDGNIIKRKSFFKKVIILTLSLCLIIILLFYLNSSHLANIKGNEGYNQELANYYNSYSVQDAEALLKVVHDNTQVMEEIQTKTKEKFYSDIREFSSTVYSNRSLLLEEVEKTKKHVNKIYDVYYLNDHKEKIKLISHDDYNDLMVELDDIYESSKLYYSIMNLYDKREYSEISDLVKNLDTNNYYYNEIVSYGRLVGNEIVKTIEEDVNKISEGMEYLTEEEQIAKKEQIYSVIVSYAELYEDLDLFNNDKYNELLNNYKK